MNRLAGELQFPEGPAFAPSGDLWCVEYKGGSLVRYRDGALDRFPTGGAPNSCTFDSSGRLFFCDADASAIRVLDPQTGIRETVCEAVDNERLDRPNDLVFDNAGSLLFTCPGNSRQQPTGYVCCLSPQGQVTKIAEGLYFPNGLTLDPTSRTLIVAETYRHRLWLGRWDSSAREWRDASVFAEAGGPVGPDGLAFRSGTPLAPVPRANAGELCLYAAVYGQRAIKLFDLSGALLRTISTPGANPTNVAFDPTGRLGLVITEAERGELLSLPEEGQ